MPVTLHRYRVMFDDGQIHDFIDIADTSTQRQNWRTELGYKDTKGPAILGVAHLGTERRITFTTPADTLFDDDGTPAQLDVKNAGAYL
jgi:hypothetical protein